MTSLRSIWYVCLQTFDPCLFFWKLIDVDDMVRFYNKTLCALHLL